MEPDVIVRFFSGGRDDRGRTLDVILAWDDDRLEAVHDYIQWLFPTIAPSGVNPYAPLITADTIAAFRRAGELRERLRTALDRMLVFYGLRHQSTAEGKPLITVDPARFRARAGTWLTPGNHNHLRLTRIMQSLHTLGLEEDARALQRCLMDIADGPYGQGRITPTTRRFWSAALDR